MTIAQDAASAPPRAAPVIEVRCPADGRLVGSVPNQSAAEVEAAAEVLRAAQPAWDALGPEGRAVHLRNWRDWLFDNERRLAELVQAETGKAWTDAALEPTFGPEIINFLCKHAPEYLTPRKVAPSGPAGATKRSKVVYRPYPLVGMIMPWNGPLAMPMLDAIGALLAGCAVLTKPSEFTPIAWREAAAGWNEAGGPAVLGYVSGGGTTGAAVVDTVDMVMFTGSARTGKRIAARCGERLIPCSLELGGKDAMIVLSDADVDRAAAAAAWGSMLNAGQACISVERVYVEAPVYDEFIAKVTPRVAALKVGMDAPGEFRTEVGAIATPAQLELIASHVDDAVAKGARALTGGKREGLQFFQPTVLVDVDHSMDCMRLETFGPTMPVMKVADEEEAIRLANDSAYGLSASVFTRDPERGERVAARLQAGSVNINNVLTNLFQLGLPMGGWKESGLGARLGGANALLKFCHPQAIVSERLNLPAEPYWYPLSPRKAKIQARVVRMLGARDWRRRLGR